MPRLFIGIPLPESYQEKLKPFTGRLNSCLESKIRWISPGNWHLTLKFLGDVEESRMGVIKDALSAIEYSAFEMRTGDCGCFPNMRKPRVIWKSVSKGGGRCEALAGAVENALEPLGFERENRPFKSHLTIGRVKKLKLDDWEACLQTAGQEAWPGFTVDRFFLWQSELNPDGAVHTVLSEFPLNDG